MGVQQYSTMYWKHTSVFYIHCNPSSEKTWTMRTTFPEYVVALASIVGSVLFAINIWWCWYCLSSIGTYIFFHSTSKGCYHSFQYIKEATKLG
ncbi:LIMR family protein At3g08930-like [Vigna radiata var. radiata]|uniref:LIMR family protein At3g08930-like n=1 Tax=Vigna radiata var. radiata TaxID=3916 RepID=A0A1S3U9Q1_VIGRR|nr:LIMR family protein At3g08930-like [Vigna radiata var. radiata]